MQRRIGVQELTLAGAGVAWRRTLLVVLAAWLMGGLVVGLLARGAMRLAVLYSYRMPIFTLEGTAIVVATALLLTAPGALLYTLIARRTRGPWWAKGLLAGLVLLAMPGIPFLATDAEIAGVGEPLFNRLAFGALFVAYGLTVGGTVAWVERRWPLMRKPRLEADPAPN